MALSCRIDLSTGEGLPAATAGAEAVVHAAGRLFAPRPERFLHQTNVRWLERAATAATSAGAERFVLLSFPHIEEGTTPERPATGRQDVEPRSVHARTRLEAERRLLALCDGTATTPVILRSAWSTAAT